MINLKVRIIKFLAVLLVILTIFSVMANSIYAKEIKKLELIDSISRQVDTKDVKIGDILKVTYTIKPKRVEIINKAETQKDIAMVIDTSGSMDWVPGKNKEPKKGKKSRLDIMKDVAIDFVSKFQDNDKAKIAIVQYSTYAAKILELTDVKSKNIKTIETMIRGLCAGGSTNIGDGIRTAYHMTHNEFDEYDKFVVLMTDGYPEAYSAKPKKKQFYEGDIVETWLDSNYLKNYRKNKLSWYNYDCYQSIGIGGADYDYDYRKESLKYAEKMAKKLSQSGVKTFIIGFGCDKYSSNESIAKAAGGRYYYAEDEKTIHRIYSDIQDKIENSIYGDAEFCESFSNNLEVLDADNLPFGLEVVDNKVAGKIPSIEYSLVRENLYEAEPISFTVKYRVNFNGKTHLGKDSSSYVKLKVGDDQWDYEDVKYFDPFVVNMGYGLEFSGKRWLPDGCYYKKGDEIQIKYAVESAPIKLEHIDESMENEFYINISDADFVETFPNGLNPIKKSENQEIIENQILMCFKDIKIKYSWDIEKKEYHAEPLEFAIFVDVLDDGDYILEGQNSLLSFKDAGGIDIKLIFNDLYLCAGTSIIKRHGLYTEAFPYVIEKSQGIAATERVPIKLALEIDVNSQYPDIYLKFSEDLSQEKVRIDIWEIKGDGSKTKRALGELNIEHKNGESYLDVNKIDYVFEKGKGYIVAYEFEPSQYHREGTNNLAAVVDGMENVLNIKLVPLPSLK